MVFIIATRFWEGWSRCVKTWLDSVHRTHRIHIESDMRVLDAYQHGYESTTEEILALTRGS